MLMWNGTLLDNEQLIWANENKVNWCMDSYKIMASVVSLEKIEILEVKEFMPSEVRLKWFKNILSKGLKLPLCGNFVDFYPKPSKSRKT